MKKKNRYPRLVSTVTWFVWWSVCLKTISLEITNSVLVFTPQTGAPLLSLNYLKFNKIKVVLLLLLFCLDLEKC